MNSGTVFSVSQYLQLEVGKEMTNRFTSGLLGALAVSILFLSACGDDSDSNSLDVQLSEWSVTVEGSADAGEVSISAENAGGELHELVIVKGIALSDLGGYADETGFVVEDDLPEGSFIGEIEEFDAGTTEDGTFDLPAGDYIFFCNIVEEEDDGSYESHYLEGMVAEVSIG